MIFIKVKRCSGSCIPRLTEHIKVASNVSFALAPCVGKDVAPDKGDPTLWLVWAFIFAGPFSYLAQHPCSARCPAKRRCRESDN